MSSTHTPSSLLSFSTYVHIQSTATSLDITKGEMQRFENIAQKEEQLKLQAEQKARFTQSKYDEDVKVYEATMKDVSAAIRGIRGRGADD